MRSVILVVSETLGVNPMLFIKLNFANGGFKILVIMCSFSPNIGLLPLV